MTIRAATRGSTLARWQTAHVAALIAAANGSAVDAVIVSTAGDRDKTTPLHEIGGKGVFVKEVQAAVLDGRADIAVHSAKDLPALTPDGLVICAVPDRADARDALVGCRLANLPDGAKVGTGSIRRQVQLAAERPDVELVEIRGNIDTRLGRIGELDAVVMAAAALDRLGLTPAVVDRLDVSTMLPQVGQGTLAIECRADDQQTLEALVSIDVADAHRVLDAERAFLVELDGDCDLPAGAYAELIDGDVRLRAMLSNGVDVIFTETRTGPDGALLGQALAVDLRDRLA
ncbi:MAG: hydroxymethylbilane synthase [Verrucomicrobiales bacterium]|jgi:hydroxymethylbilane synthase